MTNDDTGGMPAASPAVERLDRNHAPPRRSRILAATALSFVLAVLLLVALIVPAEYGLDPLGSGALLGLTALSDPPPRVASEQSQPFRTDHISFVLGAFQSVEYKYRLEDGAALLYAWRADRPVRFDLHGEPAGKPEAAQSFARGEASSGNGDFTAPFSGLHGWYWENADLGEITIEVHSAGFFEESIEFFDGNQYTRTGRPLAAPPR